MKHPLLTLAGAAVVGLLTTSAFAAIDTPHVAGTFQGWLPGDHPMTETSSGSGIWTATFNGLGANERHEFKITDGTWDNSVPGANSWLFTDAAGSLTITYDTNVYGDGWLPDTERIGVSVDPGAWTAVGSFQSEVGGTDWTNNDPATAMTDMGGGVYSFIADPGAGDWEWKAVFTGSWDAIGGDGRTINAANIAFTLGDDEYAILSVNAFDGTYQTQIMAVPEPTGLALAGLGSLAMLRRRR